MTNGFLILTVGSLANLLLGTIVWRYSRKISVKAPFFLLTLALVLWSIANHISVTVSEPATILLWMRVVMSLATLQAASFLLFALSFPDGLPSKYYKHLPYFTVLILVTLVVTQTGLLFSGVDIDSFTGQRGPIVGPGMLVFLLVAVGSILLGLINLIIKYLNYSGKNKVLISYLFIGIFIMFFMLIFNNLILVVLFKFDSNVQLGPIYTLPFVLFTSYAILKHQLFDIRVVIRKIVVYSTLLVVIFGVYSGIVFALTAYLPLNQTVGSLVAALLIAIGFEPLKKRLQTATEKFLFVSDYDPDEEIKKLSATLSNVIDLDEALRSLMQSVMTAVKLERAATVVLTRNESEHITKEVDDLVKEDKGEKPHELNIKSVQEVNFKAPDRLLGPNMQPVIEYFNKKPTIQLVQTMTQEIEDAEQIYQNLTRKVAKGQHLDLAEGARVLAIKKKIVNELTKLKIAIVIPIMVKNKLVGLVFFGDKLSNDSFYEQDLNFLGVVGSQTANAIEKARFYEEDQLKSEFVSIASHELLTPTAAIEGYLSMILEEKMGQIDPKAEEYLWKVFNSSKRLSRLVKDLLSISRIESGRIKIEPKVFNLNELVQQQIDQLSVRAQEASLYLKFNPTKAPVEVFADPERVAQAVVNIVGNGIKYTKKGGVEVKIVPKSKQVELQVIDTGVGLSAEDREHLFQKFSRIDNRQTAGIAGTGLGLYITKSMIELMGGSVAVQSKVGVGSTFSFTLPRGSARNANIKRLKPIKNNHP